MSFVSKNSRKAPAVVDRRKAHEEMRAASREKDLYHVERPVVRRRSVINLIGEKVAVLAKFSSLLAKGPLRLQMVNQSGTRGGEMSLSGPHDPAASDVLYRLELHFKNKGHCIVKSLEGLAKFH